jgi:hypothetical protein
MNSDHNFMISTKASQILSYHLSWISKGYSFDDILAIQRKLSDNNPFEEMGLMQIQFYIGGSVSLKKAFSKDEYQHIKFLIIDSDELSGDIAFIKNCTQLENLIISGEMITDISFLEKLVHLKTIDLKENSITTLKPILHFTKLNYLRIFLGIEEEVFELITNSKQCVVSYCLPNHQGCFKAYWINNWVFIIDYTKYSHAIKISIQALLYKDFIEKGLSTTSFELKKMLTDKLKSNANSLLRDNENILNDHYIYYGNTEIVGHFQLKL